MEAASRKGMEIKNTGREEVNLRKTESGLKEDCSSKVQQPWASKIKHSINVQQRAE